MDSVRRSTLFGWEEPGLKVMFARGVRSVSLLMALLVAGCGGGAEGPDTTLGEAGTDPTTSVSTVPTTTATTSPTTTTTVAATTTTVSGGGTAGVGLEDIPPECVAVMTALLQAFEPVVKDIDWETATIDEHLGVMMSMASVSFPDTSGCDDAQMAMSNDQLDITDEAGSALFYELANQVAPGAVGYFMAIVEINEALDGRSSTGECAADIAIFEDVVAGGVPWVELPLPEQWFVLNLMSSIGYCNLQTQGELRSRPEVDEFLAGAPFG